LQIINRIINYKPCANANTAEQVLTLPSALLRLKRLLK
jgi:hypothetical protein